jgi:hypothetical protein
MLRMLRRSALTAALSLAAAGLFVFNAAAATSTSSCTPNPYAYAGLIGNQNAGGVKATITAASAPQVASGHVAGWVGVGGPGQGAGGQDAWIQIGINSLPGTGNTIYAEAWIPGHGQAYKELGQVEAGQPVKVAVLEVRGRPGWWQATMDGNPVTKAVYLPGSHNNWQPMVISESWNGGQGMCNKFAYRFAEVQMVGGSGGWKPIRDASALTDPGYRITNRTAAGFSAGSAS